MNVRERREEEGAAANDQNRSNFIACAWDEVIKEGLKEDYPNGGKKLWRMMKRMYPDQLPEEFPVTEEARAIVCKHFPTRQKLEEQWAEENTKMLCNKLESLGPISNLFPSVLRSIIAGYAVSLLDTEDSAISTE